MSVVLPCQFLLGTGVLKTRIARSQDEFCIPQNKLDAHQHISFDYVSFRIRGVVLVEQASPWNGYRRLTSSAMDIWRGRRMTLQRRHDPIRRFCALLVLGFL